MEVAPGLDGGLAVLAGDEGGEALEVLLHEVAVAEKHAGAVHRRRVAPGGEGGVGGGDGGLGVGLRADRTGGDGLAGRGIKDGRGRGGGRGGPEAGDVVLTGGEGHGIIF